MTKPKDGGPAFPTAPQLKFYPGEWASGPSPQPGMSLRDWFAGMSLYLVAFTSTDSDTPEDDAKEAYRRADAMLAEREGEE